MSNPSLLCVPYRFKTSTLYSQIPDSGLGDFTVTRSASNAATRVNSAGRIETVLDNVPRLDYPLGGISAGCPALLVEPSGTNLALQSENFGTTWSPNQLLAFGSGSVLNTTATLDPYGTNVADLIVANTTGGTQHRIEQTTVSASGSYTFSVFVKAAGYNFAWVRIGTVGAFFNLSNGAVTDISAGIVASSQNYGNGWYRCIVSKASSSANEILRINIIQSAPTTDFAGDGTSGIYVFGAQYELNTVATSYIPTTTGSVTRGAEVVSKTGVSSLIGQTQGTIYAEFSVDFNNRNADILSINAGNSNNGFFMSLRDTSVVQLIVRTLGNNELIFQRVGAFSIGVNKLAMAYKNGDFAICLNGTAVQTNTNNITMPSVSINKVGLGDSALYVLDRQLRIRSVALYTTRLTNAQLQSLTQ